MTKKKTKNQKKKNQELWSVHSFQAIEMRKTAHTEVYTEIETKDLHLVYVSPFMLQKHQQEIQLDDNIRERLRKDNVTLPQVSPSTVSEHT